MDFEKYREQINVWYDMVFNKTIFSSSFGSDESWNKVKSSVDRVIIKAENETMTMVGIKFVLKDAKQIFIIYSAVKRLGKVEIEKNYEDKIARLLKAVVNLEIRCLELFLLRLPFGDRLDLSQLFTNQKYVNAILEMPVDNILEMYFEDKKVVELPYIQEPKVYITETGKSYHIADCPYCKNADDLYEIKQGIAINYGLKPCRCIERKYELIYEREKNDNEYMTAYIDESNRNNPWIDEQQVQGSYSYYICKGNQSSEVALEDVYIMDKGLGVSDGNKGITYVTCEAIANVLFKLKYRFDFNKKVKIYIDNLPVAQSWKKDSFNKKMADEFESVEVIYIPRKKNKLADALGRQVSIIDVPTPVYRTIVKKCEMFDEIMKAAFGRVIGGNVMESELENPLDNVVSFRNK